MSDEAGYAKAVELFVSATPPVGAPIEDWRSGFEQMCANFPLPADALVEPVELSGVPGLRIDAPGTDASKVVLHFHSGGYVEGSARAYREFCYRLAKAAGTPVLVIDYRLAPEFLFPAPIEDAVAAYESLLDQYAPENIVVTGDSVGGAMVISTMMALRDKGTPLPAAGVTISGNMELAGVLKSFDTNKDSDPLIDRHMSVEMGKVYIGDLDPMTTVLASPLFGKHHGLPPLLMLASDSEVLRDGTVLVAKKVRAAGGSAQLSLQPGMIHIWTLFPFLEAATESMALIGGFIREHLSVEAG